MWRIGRLRTDLGWFAWVESAEGLESLTLGHASRAEAEAAMHEKWEGNVLPDHWSNSANSPLAEALARYCRGERVDFSEIPVAGVHSESFGGRVLAACRAIPWGQTMTYGQLAALAGSPRAARAVGNCMARNRLPIVIPCHRVLPAAGRLGNYSAPGGTAMKKRLLALEGAGGGCASIGYNPKGLGDGPDWQRFGLQKENRAFLV